MSFRDLNWRKDLFQLWLVASSIWMIFSGFVWDDKGCHEHLRPHLRVEMSFYTPALKPINRPLQSLIAQAQKQPPEVSSFPCIDPVETAADKLSTLAWRVCACARAGAEATKTIRRSSGICMTWRRSKAA
jgi:hypothetical protein